MIDIRTNLKSVRNPKTDWVETAKTIVMEMDADSALYLSTILMNVQGESEETRAFCVRIARHLYETGSKAR